MIVDGKIMKKIKTAEEYLLKEFHKTRALWTDLNNILGEYNTKVVVDCFKQAQLDMLEHAVNKCAENAELKYRQPRDDEDFREMQPYDVNKQSILKTIDEIKKELE